MFPTFLFILQNVFSHRPPLYDLFDKAEFHALHTPCIQYQLAIAMGHLGHFLLDFFVIFAHEGHKDMSHYVFWLIIKKMSLYDDSEAKANEANNTDHHMGQFDWVLATLKWFIALLHPPP